jgi:2-iminobutanoate/2-iminopropanoate deaminase
MNRMEINPETVSLAVGGYSHAVEVRGPSRLLFISGQIPEAPDGSTPSGFAEQCELVWRNIGAVLAEAGMSYQNLVKVTTFLTHAEQAEQNSEIRRKHLGTLRPALTVVVVETLDSKWLLEVEAIAVA